MPRALKVDWTLAKELFISGLPLSRVADRLNVRLDTVCARAKREGWRDDIDPERPAEVPEADAIRNTAKQLADQTVTISKRVLAKVERMAIDTPVDAKNVAASVSSAYLIARRALGLDENSGIQRVMHYHIVDQAVAVERSSAVDAVVVDDSVAPDAMVLRDAPTG